MKLHQLLLTFLISSLSTVAMASTSVLFIGNSFTYGWGSPVRHYRASTVTDLNNEGIGGMPALFKSFADQAGLDYDVLTRICDSSAARAVDTTTLVIDQPRCRSQAFMFG